MMKTEAEISAALGLLASELDEVNKKLSWWTTRTKEELQETGLDFEARAEARARLYRRRNVLDAEQNALQWILGQVAALTQADDE